MAFDKRRNLDILLGAFVCFGIVLLFFFIFLIGRENKFFDSSAHIDAYFGNVVGLSVGADVMLSGVQVGYVDRVDFPKLDPADHSEKAGKIRVILRIPQDKLNWIRMDSLARIDSKGLLGDKIINISIGTPSSAPIKDGGVIASVESIDFSSAMVKAEEVLEHVTGAVQAAKDFIESFVAKGGDEALAGAAKSVRSIAEEIQQGDGLAHRLIYSKSVGDRFSGSVEGLDKVLDNLNKIVGNTADGQGTLGRLLIDPSIYDDLKLILGNVERNRALKTLIRYTVSQKKKTKAAGL